MATWRAPRSRSSHGLATSRFFRATTRARSPIRVSSLSLAGGPFNDVERERVTRGIVSRLKEFSSKSHDTAVRRFDGRDILYYNNELCFVHAGLHSSPVAWRTVMSQWPDLISAPRLAIVRDVFDRDESRGFLRDVMRPVYDDVVVMHDVVFKKRRMVNEFIRKPDGTWELARNDLEFVSFVHQCGLRIIRSDDLDTFNATSIRPQQSTNHVIMVAPTAFSQNTEAVLDNKFMAVNDESVPVDGRALQRKVLSEYQCLYESIIAAGVNVHLFTHEPEHETPDAVFPNNWFSTHTDFEVDETTLVLYPMKVVSRRRERRPEFLERISLFGRYKHVIDLSLQENASQPRFLEGTGSLVLDRINRVAYVALSERSDGQLADKWGRLMGYRIIKFRATDSASHPIYHTNVMMCVGSTVAVVCLESVDDPIERKHLYDNLSQHHTVVDISRDQIVHFCGNVLELENADTEPVMVMSTQAFKSFTDEQKQVLLDHEKELIHADISTLERVGGGGTRCTIAELF